MCNVDPKDPLAGVGLVELSTESLRFHNGDSDGNVWIPLSPIILYKRSHQIEIICCNGFY